MAHEILALELITLLLAKPTDDSVEVALEFTKDIGHTLHDLSPQGLHSIFERFRGILHEGQIDKRVQFMIEGLFALRKVRVCAARRRFVPRTPPTPSPRSWFAPGGWFGCVLGDVIICEKAQWHRVAHRGVSEHRASLGACSGWLIL